MKRIMPDRVFNDIPCSMVAVGCALGNDRDSIIHKAVGLKNDGYLTLNDMNKYIRSLLPVQKKEYYKRGTRPVLKDILTNNNKKAVVCLLGHYIYIDNDNYYSFFDNDEDEVVCIWWLK